MQHEGDDGHVGEEDLALLALGEPVAGAEAHLAGCDACRRDLEGFRATVVVARAADVAGLPPAPPAVWDRITRELGLPRDAAAAAPPARRDRTRTRVLVAAAVLAVAAAGVVATAVPWRGEAGVGFAALGPAIGTGAAGSASLVSEAGGRFLQVRSAGLPDTGGFYEVWLLDPASSRMLALGTLDADGKARLSVPEGVSLADYPTVDVSDEPDDGVPAHSGVSVLRAALPAASS